MTVAAVSITFTMEITPKMKNVKRTALSLTIAAVTALCVNAQAKGFAEITDTDGDGVISANEIREARNVSRAAMLEQFDVNGDGELSSAERGAARDAREAEMLGTFDTDGDGQLSHAERGAARDAQKAAMQAALDVDGDGVVSDAERAGIEEIRAERDNRRADGEGRKGKKRSGDQDAV